MSTHKKLAVFDIDGTLVEKDGVHDSVIRGLIHLQSRGFITTVSTGRGYHRAKEVLGSAFESIVSPDALMIVEHGTKIVGRDGTVIIANFLLKNELDHIVDFTRANIQIVDHIRFWSSDSSRSLQVWCEYKEQMAEIRTLLEKKGYQPDVFCCSYEKLLERLVEASPSNVSVKLKSYVFVENLKLHFTRSEIDTIFQDGLMEFVRNIADKGRSVEYLKKHYGISVADVLIAGNAINDIDMLNLDAGVRILIGDEKETETVLGYIHDKDEVIRLESPQALGLYLEALSI